MAKKLTISDVLQKRADHERGGGPKAKKVFVSPADAEAMLRSVWGLMADSPATAKDPDDEGGLAFHKDSTLKDGEVRFE